VRINRKMNGTENPTAATYIEVDDDINLLMYDIHKYP